MTKTIGKDFKRRTIESLMGNSAAKQLKELKREQINTPLLQIPPQNVVPDELHLMLCITDVLLRNLISGAMSHDLRHARGISDILKKTNGLLLNLLGVVE